MGDAANSPIVKKKTQPAAFMARCIAFNAYFCRISGCSFGFGFRFVGIGNAHIRQNLNF